MPTVNLSGLRLDIDIHYAESTPSTEHENGYSELEWVFTGGTDEIGEPLSFKMLDFIKKEYQSDIERAIWAQIVG